MIRAAIVPAIALVAAIATPLAADDEAQGDGTARSKVKPARLIEFTGNREMLKTSERLRVWRAEVGYKLDIDTAGVPTDCELTDKFRMNYVNDRLCEVLLKHHTFEPAVDGSGAAVEGSYEGSLNFVEMREKE